MSTPRYWTEYHLVCPRCNDRGTRTQDKVQGRYGLNCYPCEADARRGGGPVRPMHIVKMTGHERKS